MSIEVLTVVMFGSMALLLLSGLPVAFVLGGCAMLFGLAVWGPASMGIVLLKASDIMRANLLVAIPLFVFMALMLQRSGLAESLYQTLHIWMGGLPGGLAAGSVIGCTLIAAMSGISTTGVLMMGLIGYPSMAKRGYSDRIIVGSIMAGGALGILIPPSVILIVYGLIAQESVGRLFLGGVFPGLLLASLFISYLLIRCWHRPELGPPVPVSERATLAEKLVALRDIVAPLTLVLVVLGSMFAGVATPTEAAAIGAAGAIVSAALNRRLSFSTMQVCAEGTLRIVAMIIWIVLSAEFFAAIYSGIGASRLIQTILTNWDVSRWVVLALMQMIWISLGMLMEALSVLLITAPIFIPVATALGFDPVWFGILFVVNMEMGFLTPPFGINLFVMKGILKGTRVTLMDIYLGALPFVGLQFLGLCIVIFFPGLTTWLPNLVFGK